MILCCFYQSFIESLLCFSFICWFNSLTVKNRNSLNRIVNTCSKIISVRQRDLSSFCDQQTIRKAKCIICIYCMYVFILNLNPIYLWFIFALPPSGIYYVILLYWIILCTSMFICFVYCFFCLFFLKAALKWIAPRRIFGYNGLDPFKIATSNGWVILTKNIH